MTSTDSATKNSANSNAGLSQAQILMQKHVAPSQESHNPTVEEVPDEEDLKHGVQSGSSSFLEPTGDSEPGWGTPMSSKAAGKQKENPPAKEKMQTIDLNSEQSFPGLGGGAPKPAQARNAPGWPKFNGANGASTNGSSTPGSSTPKSGANTPPAVSSAPRGGPLSLAGQIQAPLLALQKNEVLPRNQLKKPLPDLLKDINKKLRTNVTMTTGEGGVLEFRETSNQKEAIKQQAIKELGTQICPKTSAKVSIPQSIRSHIIGKGGATIKSLQEQTGARIQMPKSEGLPTYPVDEDDDIIDIVVEGNPFAISMARKAIAKIVNERGASVTTKLRTIPAELYPFLTGPAESLESRHGVQIRVPPYHTWTAQPPPQRPSAGQAPSFLPAFGDNHITFAGDRAAVQTARAEIEQLSRLLQEQLTLENFSINKGRHQFIIGDRGVTPQEFFTKTGCAVILPGGADEDSITLVGPAEKLEAATDYAMTLASDMNSSNFDISKIHRNAPGGGRAHALNITKYLRDRRAIEAIERLHNTHIETPFEEDGAGAWEIYSRDAKNGFKARSDIDNMVQAYPPSRIATVPVDPFFHPHVQKVLSPKVKEDYGVHVVIPAASELGAPMLLVFEGPSGLEPGYQIPSGQPSEQEIQAFQQGLDDARKHILEIISKQAQITSTSIEVPKIFHEKLRRFIKKEQEGRAPDQIPVRVSNEGSMVIFNGPAPAVEALAAKATAFLEEAIEDEKERGFSLSFDFPQQHANQLIGKGGSNIRELREKFDVEINVNDGKVELKGPKAKADAAKAHIISLGKHWADEVTYTLKIDPKYHRDLIGAQGVQINRLQTRYKVQIHFPRSAKPAKDDHSSADAASEAGRRAGRREQELDEVIVKGPKKGADEARDEILSLLQYYKDNGFSAIISVQASQIPSLIGQRGSGMDEIRQLSGARIDIPNARDLEPSTRVEIGIKGTKTQVAQAKKLIEEKRDVFDQTVTKTIEVEKKHHRALIGTGGSVLREIVVGAGGSDDRRELAKTVQFPKAEQDGNLIKIEGKADVVDKIIAAMQKLVAERESQITEIIDVPTDKHRSLIGRGGETKKDLEAKFAVSIDIPRQGADQTGIKITGLPAAVESAKTHILDLVKDQEGITVQVPKNIHHTIADNGAFFRKLRNDFQVTVDHAGNKVPPKPTQPNTKANGGALPLITDDVNEAADVFSWHVVDLSDSGITGDIPWILRGNADNLPKAKSTLEAAISQALKGTCTGYLGLPDPRTYRYVIGQGGSNVNNIRKATGCKVSVPRNQSDGDKIEVIGTAEGVERARELILKAVREGGSNSSGEFVGGRGASGGEHVSGNGNWE